jgi:hypothetical protein
MRLTAKPINHLPIIKSMMAPTTIRPNVGQSGCEKEGRSLSRGTQAGGLGCAAFGRRSALGRPQFVQRLGENVFDIFDFARTDVPREGFENGARDTFRS